MGDSPTLQLLLQAVAIGAGEEVTKAFDGKAPKRDSVSVQAVTRVNTEQAAKRLVMGADLEKPEGKPKSEAKKTEGAVAELAVVVVTACRRKESTARRETLGGPLERHNRQPVRGRFGMGFPVS